ncbi:MAG: acylphosphatase [Chloroflexi bacterium]|nr:acylphosphatase [Chloroflexota bacterium]
MTDRPSYALHAVVRGRVQGVGFRDYVESRARSLGLTGYVRNLPDGRSLEVVAEGPRRDLERLAGYLRQGPSGAHVTAVDTDWRAPTGAHPGFRATY